MTDAASNPLQGMACPQCGSKEPFDIGVDATVRVHSTHHEFVTLASSVYWQSDTFCRCVSCDYESSAGEFYTEE